MNTLCQCGCGEPVRERYRPGHDARHVAQLVRRSLRGENVYREVGRLGRPLQRKFADQLNHPMAALRAGVVDGLDVEAEFHRLLTLRSWEGKFEQRPQPPQLVLRRLSMPPTSATFRLGTATPGLWLIRLTLYKGLTANSLRETLVHELAHLVVGADRDARGRARWHGKRFKLTMQAAFAEAYGPQVDAAKPRFSGEYAAALQAGGLHPR